MYYALALFAFNIALMLINSIDTEVWQKSLGTNMSLFGKNVQPYAEYNDVMDAQGGSISFSSNASVYAAVNRTAGFGPTQGVLDTFGFWTLAKTLITTIINFFYRGFFGLPAFLRDYFGLDVIFVGPLYIIVGLIEIFGLYEVVRGSSA
jgi:hypothetical protein